MSACTSSVRTTVPRSRPVLPGSRRPALSRGRPIAVHIHPFAGGRCLEPYGRHYGLDDGTPRPTRFHRRPREAHGDEQADLCPPLFRHDGYDPVPVAAHSTYSARITTPRDHSHVDRSRRREERLLHLHKPSQAFCSNRSHESTGLSAGLPVTNNGSSNRRVSLARLSPASSASRSFSEG